APQRPGQAAPAQTLTRDAALATSPRVAINTARQTPKGPEGLAGSIALKGGRIDDVSLLKYRETVDPKSPPIVLLSPSGAPEPFYAQSGWTAPAGVNVKLPGDDTLWTQEGSGE